MAIIVLRHGVGAVVVALVVLLAVDAQRIKPTETFSWPADSMGQRTSERISAGKRAAKHIACTVCEERLLSLLPRGANDIENIAQSLQESVLDRIGDAKKVCEMRGLANIFRRRHLEVIPNVDGSADLRKRDGGDRLPTYEEINTSDLAFHWKSFAVQHACLETFRRDGDKVATGLQAVIREMENHDIPSADALQRRLLLAARTACHQAKTCKAAEKLVATRTIFA